MHPPTNNIIRRKTAYNTAYSSWRPIGLLEDLSKIKYILAERLFGKAPQAIY
jgi:hypothetical protein